MSTSSRQPTSFLDLPLELRLQIYRYYLVRINPIIVRDIFIFSNSEIRDEKKNLLLISKKVRLKALEVLYGDNIFQVCPQGAGGHYLAEIFTEANRRRMRMMQVLMYPYGVSSGWTLDSTVFSPVLGNLKKLSIVAQRPENGVSEGDLENWIGKLRAILQYIACQLSDTCIVEVDDDDRAETSAVMRECLPSGYQKVQTVAGDFRFKRNNYSLESGCWDDDDREYLVNDVDSDASEPGLLPTDGMLTEESD